MTLARDRDAPRWRVLVCDDDPDIRDMLEITLAEDFRVATVASGARAVELAVDGTADAMVLDWMMPSMDGIEVLRQLRVDDRTRELPVVMLTARHTGQDEQESLAAGASAFMRKPFDGQALGYLLHALVDERVRTQALALLRDIGVADGTAWGVAPDW